METIKEEKKAGLEQLLNSLIKQGWKPFGDNDVIRVKYGYSVHFLCRPIVNFVLDGYAEATVPLKEILTSRSSGLWQFVCENGMIEPYKMDWIKNLEICSDKMEVELNYGSSDYEAWLIESSLKDESELESFILDNIKLGDLKNTSKSGVM